MAKIPIQIDLDTHDRLKNEGRMGESFADVVRRLLNELLKLRENSNKKEG